jgi:sugar phosphate isomerase/epimerase
MKLKHGLHLAYCTNIHRGGSWEQTFQSLVRHTLAVRDRVAPGRPYAIGLRLGADAARELSDRTTLGAFRRWLDAEQCYVFTVNGFPYGRFHGGRVKEQVYAPDWTTRERLDYTNLLFDLLGELVPEGVEGSVSTVPVSFKEFRRSEGELAAARSNLWRCVEHIERVSRRTGCALHLGLEPEPLCVLETSAEAIAFFDQLRACRPGDERMREFLGVNYDCCHLAVEFEEARDALERLRSAGIRISKLHLSNALAVQPTSAVRELLRSFADDVYLHQVVERDAAGRLTRHRDLDVALARTPSGGDAANHEWRIHFHIPLHSPPTAQFGTTSGHVLDTLDWLAAHPGACSHLEMETYTWEVMPAELKKRDVEEQLAGEYAWTLGELARRGLA